jgi:hypothetical protein
LLPPEKYFKDHPEWYSEINGKRTHDLAQLCLTNEEMRKELTKNAIENLRNNPDANFISISQNDCQGYCQCEKCRAVAEEEGSQSGPLIRFVNSVAEEIEKEFPDVWVETLAYQYTRKPPKLAKPRKNTVIRLCTIECSFVQPLGEGDQNRSLREDMEGWSQIAPSLFVWDYVTNFSSYMLPHPNLRVLAPNIRFFVDHHTIGLFEQGDALCAAGDFVRMRNWVISHLLWNPALDEKQLFDEFIENYYGKAAAPYLKEYGTLLLDHAEKSGMSIGCYMTTTSVWFPVESLVRAHQLLEKALAATEDETLRRRLRRDKMPIDYVLLKDYYSIQRRAKQLGLPVDDLNDPQAALENFFARCREFNVTHHKEPWTDGDRFELFEQWLRRKFDGAAAPAPDFCKDVSPDQWYDVQNFEFNLASPEKWTFVVDDAKASNGKAIKMPGDHFEWAANYTFDASLTGLKPPQPPTGGAPKYKIFAAVRCDANTTEGTAMTLGVYDPHDKTGVTNQSLSVSEISGTDYHWIELDAVTLTPEHGQYLWFAPPKRPGEINAVYIDRIVVMRE